MIIPQKYAVLRDSSTYKEINRLINKKYRTTYEYSDQYLCVNTDIKGGLVGEPVEKNSSVPYGYTLISYEQFLSIFEEEEKEEKRRAQKVIDDKIKNEVKGLYRQKLKDLTDENVQLRYELEKLKSKRDGTK